MPTKFLHPKDDGRKLQSCAICGNESRDTVPCQGAVPDLCLERICPDCIDYMDCRCSNCKHVACPEHICTPIDYPLARLCDCCGHDLYDEPAPKKAGLDDNMPLEVMF